MTRVKRSVHARKKRRATLELAKGYRGDASRHYRTAKEAVLQADPVAMRADHPRSTLEARIELVRAGRLLEIKSLGADVNSHGDRSIVGCNIAGEERAGNCGGAKDPPHTHDSCFGVHANLLVNPR